MAQIMLCKRNIEPCLGKWTLPAGFLENGESTQAGAAREVWEEACARVQLTAPFMHLDIPVISQAYVLFRAELLPPYTHSPGAESQETKLFALDEIPFEELAFSSVTVALEQYLLDVGDQGGFKVHYGVIHKKEGSDPNDPTAYYVDSLLRVP
eukprot:scaffold3674_cov371-Prasinococcus_capsulatus_cf.AAC.8